MRRGRRRAALLGLAAVAAAAVAAPQQSGLTGPIVSSLTLFAGTGEGLFRSTDWASTWKRVEGSFSSAKLEGLGAARALILLTTQVWVGGDGIYVSDDFGETWAARARTRGIALLLPSRWPQSDPTVFAGTGFGLLRSRDGGKTFQATGLGGLKDRVEALGGTVDLRDGEDGRGATFVVTLPLASAEAEATVLVP